MSTRIKISLEVMRLMTLFSKVTRVLPKACFEDDLENLVFIVPPRTIRKVFGYNGQNIKRLTDLLKRKFKIIEYSENLTVFIKNAILPLKTEAITEEDGVVSLKSSDVKTKSLLIGRNARNLRSLEKVVGNYFPVKEIKVI